MNKLSKLVRSAIIQHSVFWVLSFYFIGSYFSISNALKAIDFVYALFFHISLLPLVYINLKILVPKFLNSKQYLIYIIVATLNIGFAILIHEVSFELLIPSLPIDYYIVSFTDLELLVAIYVCYTVLTTLLKLSRSWFQVKELEKENLALELSNLRFQINPHFLLNSLNSIYALALKQSKETPSIILRLSNMLKHILYGSAEGLIPLKKEIAYLQDYVELQKLRFSENAEISFTISGELGNQKIAPLILITFFENSFKHGVSAKATGAYAHFEISLAGDELTLNATNNLGVGNKTPEEGGIGLVNVRRRLSLLYPDRNKLEITKENDFRVNLILEL